MFNRLQHRNVCHWALPLTLLFSAAAFADTVPVGFISYDVTAPGASAQFDITNLTGTNSSGDATWPITTPLTLSSLDLSVMFSDGSTVVEPASYFTLALDGLSWDGSPIGIGGVSPQPTQATLTGTFSPTTITLFNGTVESINPGFTATVLPSVPPNLADGDLAIINATTTTSAVPEPNFFMLLAMVLGCVIVSRQPSVRRMLRKLPGWTRSASLLLALVVACSVLTPAAQAVVGHTVKLSGATTPSSGGTGTNVNVTVISGWPAGNTTPGNIVVSWETSCGGAASATDAANSLKVIIGNSERVNVTIPNSLSTGVYFVQVSDSTGSDTDFTSSNCSEIQVTAATKTAQACVPASSLGVVAPLTGPAPVYAYVPNGAWDEARTGIGIVQIETGGGPSVAAVPVSTTDDINSCAGNPATGEAVCVGNNNGVYLIGPPPANTVTTLTSGGNAFASFSGGSCQTCGVAVNSANNKAVLTLGYIPSPSNSALQVLDLATNTFSPPFPLASQVSENIVVDLPDSAVLSFSEFSSIFDVVSFNASGNFTTEYSMPINTPSRLVLDNSAVDCSTRIALSSGEGSDTLVLADLSQAIYVPGTPGSFTAPYSETTIIGAYSAGLSGAAVAPGTAHLAVVTGEFGGSSFSVLKLPATSGTGTPALVDYAYVRCVVGMTAGFDPHTMTAYVSPNNGNSYALFANWNFFPPNVLQANMGAILALARQADGHTVVTDPSGCLDPAGPIGSTVLTNIANY